MVTRQVLIFHLQFQLQVVAAQVLTPVVQLTQADPVAEQATIHTSVVAPPVKVIPAVLEQQVVDGPVVVVVVLEAQEEVLMVVTAAE